jgi:hypothetical protein
MPDASQAVETQDTSPSQAGDKRKANEDLDTNGAAPPRWGGEPAGKKARIAADASPIQDATNGAAPLSRKGSKKREKKATVPAGKTDRRTRSQGPVDHS